jgi:hypothetical protein
MTRPETLTRTPGGDPIETPELVADWDEAVRLLRAGGHRFTVNAWMILAPTVGDLMWMTPAEVLDRLACRFCDAPLSAVEVGDPMCDACLHMVHPDCKAFPVGARVRLTDGAMRIYYARKAAPVTGTVVAHCLGPVPRVRVRMDADGDEFDFTLDHLEGGAR